MFSSSKQTFGTVLSLKRYRLDVLATQSAEEEKVMPVLLWVAFWSSLMATATCFGEMSRPIPIDKDDHD
jgi:hypothetical protein